MTKEEFKLLNFIDAPIKEYEFDKMRYIGMGNDNSLEVCFDTTGKLSMFCYNGAEGNCSIEPRGIGKAVLQWKCKLDWFYGGIYSDGKFEFYAPGFEEHNPYSLQISYNIWEERSISLICRYGKGETELSYLRTVFGTEWPELPKNDFASSLQISGIEFDYYRTCLKGTKR